MDNVTFIDIERDHDGGRRLLGRALSENDAVAVLAARQKLVSGYYDGDLHGTRALTDVSVSFPFVFPDHYRLELEDSITRRTLGRLSGRKLCRIKSRRCAAESGLCEYTCVLLRGTPDLAIEYLHFAHDLRSVTIAINGRTEAEMCSDDDVFHTANRQRVLVNGEVFGIIEGAIGWFSHDLAFVRADGTCLPMPLEFGHTASEVLLAMLRIVTLKFLWSDFVPENRNRVVDRSVSDLLNDQELVVYFAVCLYFLASVHQFLIKDAGG